MLFGFSTDTTRSSFLNRHYTLFVSPHTLPALRFPKDTTCSSFFHRHHMLFVSPQTLHALFVSPQTLLFGFSTDTTCFSFLHIHYMLFVSLHTLHALRFSTDTACSLVSQMIAVEDERIAVLRELTFGLSGDHSIFLLGDSTFIDLLLTSV